MANIALQTRTEAVTASPTSGAAEQRHGLGWRRHQAARTGTLRLIRQPRVLFYHSGKEKAVVGEMKVVGKPMADPNSDDPNSVVVKVKLVRRFDHPVPLASIKADKILAALGLDASAPAIRGAGHPREQWHASRNSHLRKNEHRLSFNKRRDISTSR